MYVCLCYAITKKKLTSLIRGGCSSLGQVQKICDLGRDCGSCLSAAHKIILEAKPSSKSTKEELPAVKKLSG